MQIEQIYTGCLAQGAYYITSNGEGETIFIDGDNDYSSDIQDKLLEDVAMITLTEKEIPEIENYINKLFC